jgi:hypothetical protein
MVSPEIVNPAPDTVAWLRLTVDVPEFVSVSDRLRLLPICTLPKARLVGFAVRAPGTTPTPTKGKLRLAFVASLMNVMPPVDVPLAAGVKATEKLAACPAANTVGSVSPLMLKLLPLTLACEIVTLVLSEFVKVAVWVCFVPTVTSPKSMKDGVALNCPEEMPSPDMLNDAETV